MTKAISDWKKVEPRRSFFAHGEVTALLDARGTWHARFDLTRYKGNAAIHECWVVDAREAEVFELSLKDGFTMVSGQLGHLRKRLEE